VDLVLRAAGELTYVQCKHWRASKIDVRPGRELYGVMASGGAQRGVIVTTGTFTAAARSEAQDKPLTLIGGYDLVRLLGHAPELGPPTVFSAPAGTTAPKCPKCGSQMLIRQARRGDSPGSLFWGCPRFPSCRGTRELAG
jgi:restriction system protein